MHSSPEFVKLTDAQSEKVQNHPYIDKDPLAFNEISTDEQDNFDCRDLKIVLNRINLSDYQIMDKQGTSNTHRGSRIKTPSTKALEQLAAKPDNPNSPSNRRSSMRRKTPNKKYIHSDTTSSSIDSSSSDDDVSDVVLEVQESKAETLFLENTDVAGNKIFGFKTPKKRGGMSIVAANTPKTPSRVSFDEQRTPSKGGATPKSSRKQTLPPKTPKNVRGSFKKALSKVKNQNDSDSEDFSASESEFEAHDDSESDDSIESISSNESPTNHPVARRQINIPVAVPKTPAVRGRRKAVAKQHEFVLESDGYFGSHTNKKIITSDHTLDRLKCPRLQHNELFKHLSKLQMSQSHQHGIADLLQEHRANFAKWMYILHEGYSILCYGLGSKRNLIQRFHKDMIADQPALVVNGFFPGLTMKDVLDSITSDILDMPNVTSSPHEALNCIETEFALIPDTHLYLIVHNIDGPMLRNDRAQTAMARLAKISNIHLVASIDHINTPLLWDHSKLSDYNFSWWDVTTMLPYSDETSFENSLLVQNSGGLALSSMKNVFQSLTSNTRAIYLLVVKNQMANKGNANYVGMPFKDLYWQCREAFLVNSDLALRAQLTEFLDHKLVKVKRNADGADHLTIPIEHSLLEQFLEQND